MSEQINIFFTGAKNILKEVMDKKVMNKYQRTSDNIQPQRYHIQQLSQSDNLQQSIIINPIDFEVLKDQNQKIIDVNGIIFIFEENNPNEKNLMNDIERIFKNYDRSTNNNLKLNDFRNYLQQINKKWQNIFIENNSQTYEEQNPLDILLADINSFEKQNTTKDYDNSSIISQSNNVQHQKEGTFIVIPSISALSASTKSQTSKSKEKQNGKKEISKKDQKQKELEKTSANESNDNLSSSNQQSKYEEDQNDSGSSFIKNCNIF